MEAKEIEAATQQVGLHNPKGQACAEPHPPITRPLGPEVRALSAAHTQSESQASLTGLQGRLGKHILNVCA